jgi:N-acetylneuraminate lyase
MIALCNGAGVTHLAASKALMAMLGIDCGPVRLPLLQPNAEQLAGLRAQLAALGFFDFACRPVAPS